MKRRALDDHQEVLDENEKEHEDKEERDDDVEDTTVPDKEKEKEKDKEALNSQMLSTIEQEVMNTSQSSIPSDERRSSERVRAVYRKVHEYVQDNAEGQTIASLGKTLSIFNELSKSANSNREFFIDSEVFNLVSEVGAAVTERLPTGFFKYDILGYIDKLRKFMENDCSFEAITRPPQSQKAPESNEIPRSSSAMDPDPEEIPENDFSKCSGEIDSWAKLGETMMIPLFKTVPLLSFMNGPISVDRTKPRRVAAPRAQASEKVVPNETTISTEDEGEKETLARASEIYRCLAKKAKVSQNNEKTNFLQFICDPDSFTQTVENLFYTSFLIKEGKAAVSDNNFPVLEPRGDCEGIDRLQRKQCVVAFNFDMWQSLRDSVKDRSIPHRESVSAKQLQQSQSQPHSQQQKQHSEKEKETPKKRARKSKKDDDDDDEY
eukprot:TRINITY_DN1201_c0_g1_i1.p1 TRINITY_DN1201_c0_g1~~TRINITY_DN1201_c0_g1_i1.p1  ORF type:complete len:435 (-),score=111.10 TRINITY_DN1201_c0_g1_i1:27-1331(-)